MPSGVVPLRRVRLGARPVEYALTHSRRKTVALRVDDRGLRVSAPQRMSLKRIERFLEEHADWVLRHLDAWAERPRPASIALEEGASFPWLGHPCRIEVEQGRSAAQWRFDETGAVLMLRCARGQSVYRAAMKAIGARALEDFAIRVRRDAQRLGVVAPPVLLTNARTRWGSCSARAIRLNWRLCLMDRDLIDYVVAHEVAHLRHMDHSPAFWAVVEHVYPGARQARARLKTVGRTLPELIDPEAV